MVGNKRPPSGCAPPPPLPVRAATGRSPAAPAAGWSRRRRQSHRLPIAESCWQPDTDRHTRPECRTPCMAPRYALCRCTAAVAHPSLARCSHIFFRPPCLAMPTMLLLAPDALLLVCRFLEPWELVKLEQCSQATRAVAQRSELWRELCRQRFPTMYEGIMAKGEDSRPNSQTPSPVSSPELGPRGSRKGRQRVGSGGSGNGSVDFNAFSEEMVHLQLALTTSLQDTFAETNTRKQRKQKKAGPVKASKAQLLAEEELHVSSMRSELRNWEDEVSRRERQLAVLYAEDTEASEDLQAQLDGLRAAFVELQDAIAAKEQELIDLHLNQSTATTLDWRRVFALRTLKQRHWDRRKVKKQERLEALNANKSLDYNFVKGLRAAPRQRTCTTCFRRFVVDENTHGCCTYHTGQFVHDDTRCTCGGAIRRIRPKIDAEMGRYLKTQQQKTHGRLTSNLTIQVRRGNTCTFSYTCCGATDVRSTGCMCTRHTSRHSS
eukprot:GGOE01053369.1.p1 GENE.GGOE01053369.1~~GGOE01053369.1.p1  ORF type:complete len:491 (+),score=70.02 GGOE01053369.1:37-1509(+)